MSYYAIDEIKGKKHSADSIEMLWRRGKNIKKKKLRDGTCALYRQQASARWVINDFQRLSLVLLHISRRSKNEKTLSPEKWKGEEKKTATMINRTSFSRTIQAKLGNIQLIKVSPAHWDQKNPSVCGSTACWVAFTHISFTLPWSSWQRRPRPCEKGEEGKFIE